MSRILVIIFLVVMNVGLAADADSLVRKPLQDDTRWVFYMNTTKIADSNSGKLLVAVLKHFGFEFRFQKMSGDKSLEILGGVKEILFSGKDARDNSALILVRGNFGVEEVTAFLSELNGFQSQDVNGTAVHSWMARFDASGMVDGHKKVKTGMPDRRMYAAAIGDHSVALSVSQQDLINHVSALQDKAGKSFFDNTTIAQFSKENDGVAVCAGAWDLEQIKEFKPKNAALRKIRSITFAASEVKGYLNCLLELKAVNQKAASLMKQTLEGIKAYATLNSETDPIASILSKTVSMSNAERTVSIRMNIDTTDITPVIMEILMKKPAKTGMKRLAGN